MPHPSEPMSNLFVVSANRRYDEVKLQFRMFST
jgi:hypothetical protein